MIKSWVLLCASIFEILSVPSNVESVNILNSAICLISNWYVCGKENKINNNINSRVPLLTQCLNMTENSSLVQNYIKSASVGTASETFKAGLHWFDDGAIRTNDACKKSDLYKCSVHSAEISGDEICVESKSALKAGDHSRSSLDTTSPNSLPDKTTNGLRTLESNICEILGARKHDQEKNADSFEYNCTAKRFGETNPVVKRRNSEIHALDSGGRLQFFKDGKFILELARAQGNKPGWVSVPKKTLLPLTTPLSHIKSPMKCESLTAKQSFPDGNDSTRSSPRSKDQSWKNASPQRNASQNLIMYYFRSKHYILSDEGCKTAHLKRRRPFDKTICKTPFNPVENLFLCPDQNCGPKMVEVETIKHRSKPKKCRPKLSAVLQNIIDKLPITLFFLSKANTSNNVINHLTTAPIRFADSQNNQQHVSPRKRILREFERVSLEDGNTKRSRPKNNTDLSASSVSSKQTIINVKCVSKGPATSVSNSNTNSNAISLLSSSASLHNSSYSIHSLLGNTVHKRRYRSDWCGTDSWTEANEDSLKAIITLSKIQENDANKICVSKGTHRNTSLNSSVISSCENDTEMEVTDVDTKPNCSKLGFYPRFSTEKNCHTSIYHSNDNLHSGVSCIINSPPLEISGNRSRSISPLKCTTISSNTSRQEKELSIYPSSSAPKNFNPQRFGQLECLPTKEKSITSDGSDETVQVFPKRTSLKHHQLSLHSCSSRKESLNLYLPSIEQEKYDNDHLKLNDEAGCFSNADSSSFSSCSTLPSSSLYHLHSMCKPTFSRSPSPTSTYTPPIAYFYAPYSTAVAALRNPLWMRYTTTVLPPPDSSFNTSHLSLSHNVGAVNPDSQISSAEHEAHLRRALWKQKDPQVATADSLTPFSRTKQENNADAPLNLSKH